MYISVKNIIKRSFVPYIVFVWAMFMIGFFDIYDFSQISVNTFLWAFVPLSIIVSFISIPIKERIKEYVSAPVREAIALPFVFLFFSTVIPVINPMLMAIDRGAGLVVLLYYSFVISLLLLLQIKFRGTIPHFLRLVGAFAFVASSTIFVLFIRLFGVSIDLSL